MASGHSARKNNEGWVCRVDMGHARDSALVFVVVGSAAGSY